MSLRNALDAAGLSATRIVVPDGGDCTAITNAAKANASFAKAVYAYGEHYPCTRSCPATADVGMKFWASEDYSTVADWAGAGCWGRSLSQNWVLLNSTSTIAWSTIWSVYPKDIYFGNGLMYAMTPWSGNYVVVRVAYEDGGKRRFCPPLWWCGVLLLLCFCLTHNPAALPQLLQNPSIWTSAHHTQFMNIGWHLLQAPSSGMLPSGGSYVTATSPDGKDFTLVLETLHGACLRCSGHPSPAYDLTFSLSQGLPGPGTTLHVWQTTQDAPFVRLSDVTVAADGSLSIHIPADAMVTLSTVATAGHGAPSAPIPFDSPFPLPYADDFSAYTEDRLPRYFADQAGSFAVRGGSVQQLAPADPGPNAWSKNREPYTLLGDAAWTDVVLSATVAFNSGPPGGAPPSSHSAPPLGAEAGEPAAVAACGGALAPFQTWEFNAIAPGYLSNAPPASPPACLNVPGCDASEALIYWDCVTTGCQCGCPTFTNLQFSWEKTTGALTTPMQAGLCVTLLGSGALALKPCASGPGQVWGYSSVNGTLFVSPPSGGAALCLTSPAPPPPAPAWAGITVRAPPYPNSGPKTYDGFTLRLRDVGDWQVLSTLTVLGNGTMGAGFNSSAPHALQLSVKGTTIKASVGGEAVWSGQSSDFAMGQVALGSGYHFAAFNAFSVAPA